MSAIKMIYDSSCDSQDYQKYIEDFIEEIGISKSAYDSTPQTWERELENYILSKKSLEYDCNIADINLYENTHGKKKYVIKAFLGLWDGTYEGGKIIEGMANVIFKCSGGEELFKYFMDGRVMKFMTLHHDGTNNFWIKELTERGEKYYETHKDEMGKREMVEKLYNDRHLSKHVTIWHEIYGM